MRTMYHFQLYPLVLIIFLINASEYISDLLVDGPVTLVSVSVFGMCVFVPLFLTAPWNGRSGILKGDVKFSTNTASREMYVSLHLDHIKSSWGICWETYKGSSYVLLSIFVFDSFS